MKLLKKLLLATAAVLIAGVALAADLPLKTAQIGYPTRCGFYYGVGIGGNAGAVKTDVTGTQVVEGDIDAMVGYTCPFGGYGFWFAEVQGGISNLNGGTILNNASSGGGLPINFTGPATFIERFGAGSPINALLGGLLPAGNNILNAFQSALPSVPLLPPGITLSPANLYAFVGIVEGDYGATLTGIASSHQWMVSPMIGLGNLARASNNVMIDTWAGFQFGSMNSFCIGNTLACGKLGNMVRVGSSLKF